MPDGELSRTLSLLRGPIEIELVASARELVCRAEQCPECPVIVEAAVPDFRPMLIARRVATERRLVLVAGSRNDPRLANLVRATGTDLLELPCHARELRSRLLNEAAVAPYLGPRPAPLTRVVTSAGDALHEVADALARGEPLPVHRVIRAADEVARLAHSGVLGRLLDLLRAHHDPTYSHSLRVAAGLTLFGSAVGATGSDLRLLAMSGLLHDIGKMRIPRGLLDKPSPLDGPEWRLLRRHPLIAEWSLRQHGDVPKAVIDVAARHHERLDGTGYPRALPSNQIDDLSRLAAVVDVHVALTEPRAYKTGMSDEAAFAVMFESEEGRLESSYLRRYREILLDGTGRNAPVSAAAGDPEILAVKHRGADRQQEHDDEHNHDDQGGPDEIPRRSARLAQRHEIEGEAAQDHQRHSQA
jgi:putative nucleotidyltransferase with HDIG domain